MSIEYFEKFNGRYLADKELRDDLADIESYIGYNSKDIYGLEADFDNLIFTRLAAAVGANFDTVAPWKDIRRCNLADNGAVNAYYGDIGYIEDGSNGQCMVEIPKFYYKVSVSKLSAKPTWSGYNFAAWVSGTNYEAGAGVVYDEEYYRCETANTDEEFTPSKWSKITTIGLKGKGSVKARYYISSKPMQGFKVHPLFKKPDGTIRKNAYIGTYEGCIYDVSATAYLTEDEQVGDFTATTGDKLSSIAGVRPASGLTQNFTLTNVRKLAQNRGAGWQMQTLKLISALQMLGIIELGTFNWQNAIGAGITGITDNSSYSCASRTGSTSSLGNSTGRATSTVDYSGTVQTAANKTAISYRGIENLWGNIWKMVEGININGDGTNGGGLPYICDDETFVSDKITDNYTQCGFSAPAFNQYIKYFGYNEDYDWLFLTSKTGNGANATSPVGDYLYITTNLKAKRIAYLGGSWSNSSGAGPFYWDLNNASSHRGRNVGTRLAYLP